MHTRLASIAVLLAAALAAAPLHAQEPIDLATTRRIRDEGLDRSQALALYRTLTDDIGQRLTGSPSHRRAAEWARDRFREWGLSDPRLEPFEFGRGWELEKLSIEMVGPRYMPLTAYAEAWTPSVDGVLSGPVVYVGDTSPEELRAMAPRLRNAIVLTHLPQEGYLDADRVQPGVNDQAIPTGNPSFPPVRSETPTRTMGPILQQAGAGVTIRPSQYRDGTVGVGGNRGTADDAVPSLIMAAEQYDMLVRMAESGSTPELRIELRTEYYEQDTNSYNVIAEIPGTDPALRDEIVLVGGHLDSWHAAVGATDNGDGAVAVLESMRILAALGLRPRRTIRAVLWGGEEQGLLGARAYVAQHLSDAASRERLAVFLNDDPGSGRTVGFYMQGNPAAKEIFDAWITPIEDLGAGRNVIEGIGSTDHVPFDEIGLPAFTVIKDFDAYDERTRHTNADYPERMSEAELKESAIFLAHFAWQAAQRDAKIPRKPVS